MSAKGLTVLVIGGGGREHALAWAARRSPRCRRLLVAPGNAGTPGERVDVAVDDVEGIVELARRAKVDLVIVGPEAALAAGVVDALTDVGIAAFGPTRAAAELEASKAFARAFCERHAIPGPRSGTFTTVDEAMAWVDEIGGPVVVKADGLAAGKGVLLPDGRDATLAALRHVLEGAAFGSAGARVVLEERLVGEEVSLLAFTDGETVVPMPPAQDHKRLGEGDHGPNTGGMGAYAPTPALTGEQVARLAFTVLGPAVHGMGVEGRPYRGVLYAGLMLTADGPRVLEFNCRFGDPEAQVLLPLLDVDLLDIAEACATGGLRQVPVRWKPSTACAVVLASPGYPEAPRTGGVVTGIHDAATHPDVLVFHAGTDDEGADVVSSGGRVLSVTGVGQDIVAARYAAYRALADIRLDGAQSRRDIGWRALARLAGVGGYAAAGVDIDAGNEAVARMRVAVEATHTPDVVAGVGAFGGALSLAARLRSVADPVLVASTDGVGTKVMVAVATNRVAGLGHDLVNHCVDDVLVQNARPVAFLDYIGTSRLDPVQAADLVAGMAEACGANRCVLLGGETAEMPGVYHDGHLDVVGTLLGLADRARLLPRGDVAAGDVLIGLASSGPHTNGYSLLRRAFTGLPFDAIPDPLDVPLVDALLAPHRSYLGLLAPLLDDPSSPVKALAHITGGGLVENPPRALPDGCGAVVRIGSWPVPPLFRLVRDTTHLPPDELHRTLNMGIGMVAFVAPDRAAEVQDRLGEESWVIGEVVEGDRRVHLDTSP
jgi:phosphoribosylamine--glycine ligase/phosphoribosylaminoimidazole synthetase